MRLLSLPNGQILEMQTFGPDLDAVLDAIYTSAAARTPFDWSTFSVPVGQYFVQTNGDWGAHDKLFNEFTRLWQPLIEASQYGKGEELWRQVLQFPIDWELRNPGSRIHKGTPYYFWGMTALLRGEIDHGYLLVHQGVREDTLSFSTNWKGAPGFALVTLEYEMQNQAFYSWVLAQAEYLQARIDNYNIIHARTLTMNGFRDRFLRVYPNPDLIFQLSYTVARLMRLAVLPQHTTTNSFAGQIGLNLLFDLALIVDGAMKERTPNQWKFAELAGSLLSRIGSPLNSNEFGTINGKFNSNFEVTAKAAVDGTLSITTGAVLDRIRCDFALVYGLRNHGAHNTSSAPTIYQKFDSVLQCTFNVLFRAVVELY